MVHFLDKMRFCYPRKITFLKWVISFQLASLDSAILV
jgi:hypothetical protein